MFNTTVVHPYEVGTIGEERCSSPLHLLSIGTVPISTLGEKFQTPFCISNSATLKKYIVGGEALLCQG
jgi:hypothetical protein